MCPNRLHTLSANTTHTHTHWIATRATTVRISIFLGVRAKRSCVSVTSQRRNEKNCSDSLYPQFTHMLPSVCVVRSPSAKCLCSSFRHSFTYSSSHSLYRVRGTIRKHFCFFLFSFVSCWTLCSFIQTLRLLLLMFFFLSFSKYPCIDSQNAFSAASEIFKKAPS